MNNEMLSDATQVVASVVRTAAAEGTRDAVELSSLAVAAAGACVAGFEVLRKAGNHPPAEPCLFSTVGLARQSEAHNANRMAEMKALVSELRALRGVVGLLVDMAEETRGSMVVTARMLPATISRLPV